MKIAMQRLVEEEFWVGRHDYDQNGDDEEGDCPALDGKQPPGLLLLDEGLGQPSVAPVLKACRLFGEACRAHRSVPRWGWRHYMRCVPGPQCPRALALAEKPASH